MTGKDAMAFALVRRFKLRGITKAAACATALQRQRLSCLVIVIAVSAGSGQSAFAQRHTPGNQNHSARRQMTPVSASAFSLLIKKAERKLYVYRVDHGQSELFKTYTIALGPKPTGHKQQQGDGATPEGDYYLTHKNAKSKFYLSLGVSYPNARDAAAGLQAGLISQAEHDAIVSAIRSQGKPPQNTRLGGDIFIHGGGSGNDWTLGCIALTNEEIKELFELLPVKTPVKIAP
jgi:L,D-peptidoglycan transpeptidase YkuD (ErfK/YbiS/YcfS/YnhG family)